MPIRLPDPPVLCDGEPVSFDPRSLTVNGKRVVTRGPLKIAEDYVVVKVNELIFVVSSEGSLVTDGSEVLWEQNAYFVEGIAIGPGLTGLWVRPKRTIYDPYVTSSDLVLLRLRRGRRAFLSEVHAFAHESLADCKAIASNYFGVIPFHACVKEGEVIIFEEVNEGNSIIPSVLERIPIEEVGDNAIMSWCKRGVVIRTTNSTELIPYDGWEVPLVHVSALAKIS